MGSIAVNRDAGNTTQHDIADVVVISYVQKVSRGHRKYNTA